MPISAWVLPDHIADVLPIEARRIEELRRKLLDTALGYGYELVIPPLIEHIASLLTGTGEALDLQTFKLVDQLSGQTIGLRSDSTPQVARIDSHFLNRQGVARLSYCGPVVHTRINHPFASREPLQFGAEIYGHSGLEADLEVIDLAQSCLQQSGIDQLQIDISNVRLVDAILSPANLPPPLKDKIYAALTAKDVAELQSISCELPYSIRHDICTLPYLFGDISVLQEASRVLQPSVALHSAIEDLRCLALNLEGLHVSIDLSDLRGYAYYTGLRFSLFSASKKVAERIELARGGRYDEVGAVFGRKRAAVGFSLDIKDLANVLPNCPPKRAIRAPWGTDIELRKKIAVLRAQGETVVSVLTDDKHEIDNFLCDRELIAGSDPVNKWIVKNITTGNL